ncbi:MAG: hypothetical protein IKL53_10705, partial [Lachnospiraceae bacterium]|nr:hypothetical protein [Lachnospiraceae bacterium]
MIKTADISDVSFSVFSYVPLGLVAFTSLSFFLLSSPVSLADNIIGPDMSVNSDVNIVVPVSCMLTTAVDTPHTATVNNGTYMADIGTTTFKTVCNDSNGYSIYAIGYSDNEYGNTKMIAKVGGVLTPTNDINTGTGTNETETSGNSAWAMKVNAVSVVPDPSNPGSTISSPYRPTIIGETQGDTEDFTNYHVVPTTYTKVATLGSTTDRTIGSAIQSTYAIYIKSTQPVGLYTGQVKYTLVHPASAEPNMPKDCSANKICYFPNGNGFVTDTMADQSVGSTATSITLWPTNFKRQGYGFAGWSDKYDWVLNENDANGNGTGANAGYHIYGPMQTIEFTAGQYTTKGLSLYAVWAPSAGDIQDWICPNNTTMPIGTVTALTDKRDNDTYAVAKLADSNCWMIENLRLDYDAEHNADGSLAQGYGTSTTYGNFSGLARPETANFTADNSSATAATPDNSLYYADTKSSGSTATIDITQTSYAGYRMPRYRNDNTNTDATVNPNTTTDNMTGVNQNIYSYGNYYTWAAAIADTAYYSTSNKSVTTTSLCPTGWRLPKGGTKTRIEQPYDDNEFWN